MKIEDKVALVTGAASGIGSAVARELVRHGARRVILVDRSEAIFALAEGINKTAGRLVASPQQGDATVDSFRRQVYDEAPAADGPVAICVPAAGITRDALAVRMNKDTGRAEPYSLASFREVTETNLIAPIYWALEMVARLATRRWERGLSRWDPGAEELQGAIVFVGSISSRGNKGQISYAAAKAGLEGAAATLRKEAIFYGVRCGIIHPGFTDTPMVRALGTEYLEQQVLPSVPLGRLLRPAEIADAICFMISNDAFSGTLWADGGWEPRG